MWCHLLLHKRVRASFPLLSSFLCDKLPLLSQLLPRATERSQTAMFNVIGPFGGRTPTKEVRRSNLRQTAGATVPICVTNHDGRAADSRGWATERLYYSLICVAGEICIMEMIRVRALWLLFHIKPSNPLTTLHLHGLKPCPLPVKRIDLGLLMISLKR